MPRTLLEFFVDEATEYLDKLQQTLGEAGRPDADELRRCARALRGSARMADQDAIARVAGALHSLTTELTAGRRHWSTRLRESLETALAEMRVMVNSVKEPPADLAQRAEALAQRLGEPTAAPTPPPRDDVRFRRYLGTELRALAADIGESLGVLERDPRNREPLKKLLRRIRPLRGIEGVDDIPAVGPAVAAVEEVILKIADTSATVGPGHLVLFRRARQALDDVATDLIRGEAPSPTLARGTEIEDLKEQILGTAAQREITWISELFFDEAGPHVEACPMAERGAGSWEAFFALEATASLDTIDRLREELARDPEGARKAGQRLAFTMRQLRERAVTFGHAELGRVARRSGAALRAALDGPPRRLQAIALDLATTLSALRGYIESPAKETRAEAVRRAEDSLEAATHPDREPPVPIESLTYSADDAVARAKSLSSEIAGILQAGQPDPGRTHALLEEALGLLEHALAQTGTLQ
jgi:chemotaxis protein histidine kinase CheA